MGKCGCGGHLVDLSVSGQVTLFLEFPSQTRTVVGVNVNPNNKGKICQKQSGKINSSMAHFGHRLVP